MSEELGDLIGAVRTYLQVHGRGRQFATGDWEPIPRGVSPEALASSPSEVPEPSPELPAESTPTEPHVAFSVVSGSADLDAAPDMDALRALWGDCLRCPLAAGRQHLVFGEGAVPAGLMFVGEGPGEQEDLQGRPFVGRAGELLTRMIEAMGLSRDRVFIANIVKCRPPGNRDPEPGEVTACLPVLQAQIRLVRPRVLVSLGRISAQTLLQTATPISRLRGRWQRFGGVDLMPTFHPAYLLRSPEKKKEAWQDLQQVMERLREPHA